MASISVRRTFAGLFLRHNSRFFHNSAVAYKKKNTSNVVDDLFKDADASGDLFRDELTQKKPAPFDLESEFKKIKAEAEAEAKAAGPALKGTKLSAKARREEYNKILDFVKPRLGRKPEVKLPQVRNSAWKNLVGLATTDDQLRELSQLFPAWSASGRQFGSNFSELFVRRCEKLSCPLLALDVFGNYAKYNLKLTLPGAQQLLRSLHVKYPIDKVIATSALYSVYSLTPIAHDLVSCSMVVSACFKHNSDDSLNVAKALLPHLERMMSQTVVSPENSPPTPKDRSQAWLKWSFKEIDKALAAQNGSRSEWLRNWGLRNGYIRQV